MPKKVLQSVTYGEEKIHFSVLENSDLSAKIRIHVYPNQSVEVETPSGETNTSIETAVRKRARWITRQLDEAKKARSYVLPREYISGETHFYLGRRYKLKIARNIDSPSHIKLIGGEIKINVRVNDPAAVKRRLVNWYHERAAKYIGGRLLAISNNTNWIASSPALKIVPMQKQWGSLSPEGVVHINPCLVRAPMDCIDYVLCHELCHFIERNHSNNFYRLLKMRLPDWEQRKAKLDGMAELLLAE